MYVVQYAHTIRVYVVSYLHTIRVYVVPYLHTIRVYVVRYAHTYAAAPFSLPVHSTCQPDIVVNVMNVPIYGADRVKFT